MVERLALLAAVRPAWRASCWLIRSRIRPPSWGRRRPYQQVGQYALDAIPVVFGDGGLELAAEAHLFGRGLGQTGGDGLEGVPESPTAAVPEISW